MSESPEVLVLFHNENSLLDEGIQNLSEVEAARTVQDFFER